MPASGRRPRGALVALPALVALVLVLFAGQPSTTEGVLLLCLVVLLTWGAWRATSGLDRHLSVIGNLLAALREGDYGVRATLRDEQGEITGILRGINDLAARLQDEQRDLQQSLQLLSKTLAALDGAVFVFEQDQRLRLVNPAGERLLGREPGELLGRDAEALGLAPLFALPSGSVQICVFGSHRGRWQITHASLRSRSQAGRLLLVQPMDRALREEEALAFRRLLRVLGHEINNSMTPIISMADTLKRMLPMPGAAFDAELDAELRHGLERIGQRGAGLQRFIGGYARLAKLPAPVLRPVAVPDLCRGVAILLDDARIVVEGEQALSVNADPDQLEQVLINLLRNALEAGGNGPVWLRWRRSGAEALLQVVDEGHGLPSSDNLFVPFFTTKPDGAGIGLTLSRQIVEAQDGTLHLHAREDGRGAVAEIRLPLFG